MKANCPICYEEYHPLTNPAKLISHCMHSICLNCLRSMFELRGFIFCPFKCNISLPPITINPLNLPNNHTLSTFNTGKHLCEVCPTCLYCYVENRRAPYVIKQCGHTMCQICLERKVSIFNKKYFLICEICKHESLTQETKSLFGLNRDYSDLLKGEDNSLKETGSLLDENTRDSLTASHKPRKLFNSMTGTFEDFICTEEIPKYCLEFPESEKILNKIISDESGFEHFFLGIVGNFDLKEINKLKSKIDRLKDAFHLIQLNFAKTLEKLESSLTDLTKRIKSFMMELNFPKKFKILNEALQFQKSNEKMPVENKIEVDFNKILFRNQSYYDFFEEYASVYKANKMMTVDDGFDEINRDLLDNLKQCVDECVAIGKNSKEVIKELNSEIEKGNEAMRDIWKFKLQLNFKYDKNPFFAKMKNSLKEESDCVEIKMA